MVAPSSATTKTTWTLDSAHSIAEFGVKHMMVSTTKGRFSNISGTIELDENDLTQSTVEVTIDAASINTFDEKRDTHLKSADFLDTERFPTITFKSTKVEPNGKDRLRVFGDLTIKDVTLPVELDTAFNGREKTPWGSEVIAYSAQTTIDRKDFGLTWNVGLETGGLLVGDRVKIAIEAEASRQS
jgi:polyisoprenoid-binding protein YceI